MSSFFIIFLHSFIYLLNIYYSFGYVVIPFEVLVENYDSNNKDKAEQPLNDTEKILNEWFSFTLFSKLKIGNPNKEISLLINPQSSCFQMNELKLTGKDLNKLVPFFSKIIISLI